MLIVLSRGATSVFSPCLGGDETAKATHHTEDIEERAGQKHRRSMIRLEAASRVYRRMAA
jgi:hypothetical protein